MPKKLEPLKIACTSSDCDNGLHCFKATRKMLEKNEEGHCRSCGADLIDWDRIKKNDFGDVDYTFRVLKKELIRHHFFHIKLDIRAINHARRKGVVNLNIAARHRIEKYIGPKDPPRDGRQTPMSGNSIFYAQHAVACCCRKCIEYWHGIPQGRPLTATEIDYLSDLVEKYLGEKLPDLPQKGEKVPSIREKKNE